MGKAKVTVVAAAGIFFILLAAIIFLGSRLLYPRIVASTSAPDGTILCVYQEFNWSFEPYTTSVYAKKTGEPWAWFYYDHEDLAWLSARTKVDTIEQAVLIYRGPLLVGKYYWENNELQLVSRTGRDEADFSHIIPFKVAELLRGT